MLAGVLVILSGTFISGIGALIYDVLIVVRGPSPELVRRDGGFGISVVSFAIAFNWMVTALIVSKLWWADKRMTNASVLSYFDGIASVPITRIYQKITIVLIESGTLYSVVWLIWLVTYTMGEVRYSLSSLVPADGDVAFHQGGFKHPSSSRSYKSTCNGSHSNSYRFGEFVRFLRRLTNETPGLTMTLLLATKPRLHTDI